MRKIIFNLAVSLDGLIEGPNGEYDWCFTDQDYGMTDFLADIDSLFIGRKSYEELMRTENDPFPDKQKYVFSNTLLASGKLTHTISENWEQKVKNLKSSPGKNIWLFGGAKLASDFLNKDLIDEFQLSVHPLVLGKGKPLFSNISDKKNLKLIGAKTYDTGLVQLHYQPLNF